MANRIKLKRSNTGGSAPTTANIEVGEVAMNMADRLLYFRDPSNNILSFTIEDLNNFDTDDLTEGATNLYYTDTRVNANFSTKTTDALTEGVTNLYYTDARSRAAISATGDISYNNLTGVISYTESVNSVNGATGIVVLDTDDVSEGATNLYYTDARVDTHLNTSTAATGEFLSWNGTDYDWVAGGGGGIANVVDDTTPQLGGDLDLNSRNITGTGNIDITGSVTSIGLTNEATNFGTALIASRTNSSGTFGASFQNTKSSTLADGDFSTAAGFSIQPSTGSTAYPGFIHGEYHSITGNRLHFKLYNDGVSTFGTDTGLDLGANDAEFFDGDLIISTDSTNQTIASNTGNITLVANNFYRNQNNGNGADFKLNNTNGSIANFDQLGEISFQQSFNTRARIGSTITDTTGGSEDANMYFNTHINGVDTQQMVMESSRITVTNNVDVVNKWLQIKNGSTPIQYFYRNSNHGNGASVGQIEYWGSDNLGGAKQYSTIRSVADDNSSSGVSGSIELQVMNAGTLDTVATVDKSGIELIGYRETANPPGSSGTIAPDPAGGTYGVITLGGNITFNGFTNPIAGQSYTLVIKQPSSGGPYTLTSSMLFSGGGKTLSTTPNAVDVMTVFYDGTSYYASLTLGYA